jgi:hypothetical protein
MQQNIHSVAPSGPKMDGHAASATFREEECGMVSNYRAQS